MPKYIVEIDCENPAFAGAEAEEVARILADLVDKADKYRKAWVGPLFDANGNTVGEAKYVPTQQLP